MMLLRYVKHKWESQSRLRPTLPTAAGLVLTTPGLEEIVTAIKEGRSVFQRVLTYAIGILVNRDFDHSWRGTSVDRSGRIDANAAGSIDVHE